MPSGGSAAPDSILQEEEVRCLADEPLEQGIVEAFGANGVPKKFGDAKEIVVTVLGSA